MIQHVVERVKRAQNVSRVVVATDEKSIKDAVEAFGGEAVLTRHDHATGTDRVAEVALHETAEIYVNVQGDEPLIDPGTSIRWSPRCSKMNPCRLPRRAPPSISRTTSWIRTSSR